VITSGGNRNPANAEGMTEGARRRAALRAVRDLAVALVGAEAEGRLEEFNTVAHSARCTPYR
jgi:hypothetical protein